MSNRQKTLLITGCSPGGIGHALARHFHAKGLRVFATARKTSSISDLAELGIETLPLELSDPSSIASLRSQVSDLTGSSLDYLINNAGRNYTMPSTDIDLDEVQATFEINVFSVMRMCQAFAPLVIEAKGTILQIGSLAAVMPYVFGSVYNASKAALHAYSNTLRVELAPFGVQVVTIITGGVKSNIARTDRELPENSIYLPVNDEFQRRIKHSQDGAIPTEQYAASVVNQVLRATPKRWIWEGNKSWLVWFLSSFFPHSIGDHVFTRMFKLWKLAK